MAILGNPGLKKAYIASAPIAAFRIVKFSADGEVAQAMAATDLSVGVSDSIPAAAAGDRVEVARSGLVAVEFGGTVARGALLTSDANGKAIAAAPVAGANVRVIGIAEQSAVAGDIGLMMIALSSMQG